MKLLSALLATLLILQVFAEASELAHRGGDDGEEAGSLAKKPHSSKKINCSHECSRRCSKASRKNRCHRACNACCDKCKCVPPGTYGNKGACPCYARLKTRGNKLKCP